MPRILLLRFGAVGDVILSTSVIQTLRAALPESQILYATRAVHMDLLTPLVDEIFGLQPGEPLLAFAARLRVGAPDVMLDLHDSLRSRLLRMLLPEVPATIWKGRGLGERIGVALKHRKPYALEKQEIRYLAAAERLVGRPLHPEPTFVAIPAQVDPRLGALENLEKPLLGLAPGAGWETKRWPHFGALAARAQAEGWQVVVAGGPGEEGLCREVVGACPDAIALPDLSLPSLGWLWKKCRVVVVNDSGPMHLARAVGARTVALFGSTDPGQFSWEDPKTREIHLDLPCMPCSFFGRKTCPEGHFRCLRELEAAKVWETVVALSS